MKKNRSQNNQMNTN